jgi:hypothetical protein
MATWILYAAPQQMLIKDWAAHEGALRKLGLTVGVPGDMDVGDERAYLVVEDPKGMLNDEVVNGRERRESIKRRVRATIRWFRNTKKGAGDAEEERNAPLRDGEGQAGV